MMGAMSKQGYHGPTEVYGYQFADGVSYVGIHMDGKRKQRHGGHKWARGSREMSNPPLTKRLLDTGKRPNPMGWFKDRKTAADIEAILIKHAPKPLNRTHAPHSVYWKELEEIDMDELQRRIMLQRPRQQDRNDLFAVGLKFTAQCKLAVGQGVGSRRRLSSLRRHCKKHGRKTLTEQAKRTRGSRG